MSKNERIDTADAGDLTKVLHALNLNQKDENEKTGKASGNQHHQSRTLRSDKPFKNVSSNTKANRASNAQDWRAQAPPVGRSGPNVTTRSQTQAARSRTGKRNSSPKQYVLPRPKPTAAYIKQALEPPKPADKARELLIILDLNGTLVHRETRHANTKFTKRPFCKEFMQYLTAEHKVMIWSSAREHNVERLCKSIFEEVGITLPVHRWNRGHFHLTPKHFDMNVQLYKQLTWVWDDPTVSKDLCSEGVFDQSNTILIDDTSEKALSEPYNLIRVDEYDGTDQESDVLGKVVEYLERARRTQDVSGYIRDSPFVFKSTDAPYAWVVADSKTDERSNTTKPA